nr:hypothetical protein [uncultured Methanobrevibacter sp.]
MYCFGSRLTSSLTCPLESVVLEYVFPFREMDIRAPPTAFPFSSFS